MIKSILTILASLVTLIPKVIDAYVRWKNSRIEQQAQQIGNTRNELSTQLKEVQNLLNICTDDEQRIKLEKDKKRILRALFTLGN